MKNHENLKFLKKTSGKLKLPGFPEKTSYFENPG